jgi:hypothetical protein
MEPFVDFPDPRSYPYPEELRLPDGTLLIGKTWGESPLIMNRKTWRLYITYIRLDKDPDNPRPIVKSLQTGIVYRLPDEPIMQNILGFIKANPGATVEDVLGFVFALMAEEGVNMNDENEQTLYASYTFDVISLFAIYGLVRIQPA